MNDLFPTAVERESVVRAIRTRRSIQLFHPEKPDSALIRQAVDLARWAPNHKLTEPWRFYVLGEESSRRIAERNAELVQADRGDVAAENKLKRWLGIPGWLALTCIKSDDSFRDKEDYAACCCAAQNMMLFLWAHGVGMKWTTGPVTRDSGFYNILGISEKKEFVVSLFVYGFPAETPATERAVVDEHFKLLP
ncbi:MAG: nitroreductase [Rhodothermia bacterium]|nr:MAG: nitroreductase [Rhodothermia bacterium]